MSERSRGTFVEEIQCLSCKCKSFQRPPASAVSSKETKVKNISSFFRDKSYPGWWLQFFGAHPYLNGLKAASELLVCLVSKEGWTRCKDYIMDCAWHKHRGGSIGDSCTSVDLIHFCGILVLQDLNNIFAFIGVWPFRIGFSRGDLSQARSGVLDGTGMWISCGTF